MYRVASKSRPDGPELTWQWLEKHWDVVHAKYGGNTEASRRVGSIMEDVASLFTNETAIPVVESLFQAHRVSGQFLLACWFQCSKITRKMGWQLGKTIRTATMH